MQPGSEAGVCVSVWVWLCRIGAVWTFAELLTQSTLAAPSPTTEKCTKQPLSPAAEASPSPESKQNQS